jgi:hypothetical protein
MLLAGSKEWVFESRNSLQMNLTFLLRNMRHYKRDLTNQITSLNTFLNLTTIADLSLQKRRYGYSILGCPRHPNDTLKVNVLGVSIKSGQQVNFTVVRASRDVGFLRFRRVASGNQYMLHRLRNGVLVISRKDNFNLFSAVCGVKLQGENAKPLVMTHVKVGQSNPR